MAFYEREFIEIKRDNYKMKIVGPLKCSVEQEDVRQYTFSMPVLFDKTSTITNFVATNDTVTFAAGLVQSNSSRDIVKTGFGTMASA